MKIVKSLLLGSAAGFVAVTGTQAADLPVKARPVAYVKICSLYGEGFYYIPGTDVCLKVGGYIRAQYNWNGIGGGNQAYFAATGGAQDRTVNSYNTRHRASINFDSRSQTSFGTLRTYAAINIDNENLGVVTVNPTRAFIQWAGFTFGHTQSFTDVPGTPGDISFKSLTAGQNHSDTGANGTNQIAYSWELGNGMTLNVGADERRTKPISNFSNNVASVGANPTDSIHGEQYPNPWANFTVIQDWGRAALSVIGNPIHSVYYGAAPGAPGYATTASCIAQSGTTWCGYPEDRWGFAVLGGVDIRAPWAGPGDHFGGYFHYGQGALAYAAGSLLTSPGLFGGGNQLALGVLTDAVYVNGSGFELTTAWTVGVGAEHFWLPNFSTTVYATRTEVSYNDTVINNRWFCGGNGGTTQNIVVPAGVSCDPGFVYWMVGTHTDWYPVPNFRLAVEVLYTQIGTAFDGAQITLSKAIGARPTGVYTARDQGIVSVVFRAQRDF